MERKDVENHQAEEWKREKHTKHRSHVQNTPIDQSIMKNKEFIGIRCRNYTCIQHRSVLDTRTHTHTCIWHHLLVQMLWKTIHREHFRFILNVGLCVCAMFKNVSFTGMKKEPHVNRITVLLCVRVCIRIELCSLKNSEKRRQWFGDIRRVCEE